MSYLVLARKYRPQILADLIGQEAVARTLDNAMRLGRVHHAFVFCGARGVGKTTTARILARSLNCAVGVGASPCGECTPCQAILAGRCPDVLEIDGASNTGVDNVRELREQARYMPSLCRTKIYIIDEVHMLSGAAFNALLKILEEPPAHVKFIFATTDVQKIPLTILSRCQRFDFKRVGRASLLAHLQAILGREDTAIGDAVLQAVVREAQGSVRDALSLLDQVLSYRGLQGGEEAGDEAEILDALGIVAMQRIESIWDALLAGDAKSLLDLVHAADDRGHDLAKVAELLAEHGRDLAVIKAVPTADSPLLEHDEASRARLAAQAACRSAADLQRLFQQLVGIAEDVGRAGAPRLALEMGLLKLLLLPSTLDLQTLVRRLDDLARGGGGQEAVVPPAKAGVPSPGPAPGRAAQPDASPQGIAAPAPAPAPTPRPGPGAAAAADAAATPMGQGALPAGAAALAAAALPHAAAQHGAASAPVAAPNQVGDQAVAPVAAAEPGFASTSHVARQGGPPAPGKAPANAPPLPPAAARGKGASPTSADPHAPPPLAAAASSPAAAPPAAAPAAEGDDEATPSAAFVSYVARVRGARPDLASILEHGCVVQFDPNAVVLAYEPRTFYWQAAHEPSAQACLQAALTAQFGQSVPLSIVPVGEPPRGLSLAQVREHREAAATRGVKQAALDHAAVQNALAVFGGEVRDIRPL